MFNYCIFPLLLYWHCGHITCSSTFHYSIAAGRSGVHAYAQESDLTQETTSPRKVAQKARPVPCHTNIHKPAQKRSEEGVVGFGSEQLAAARFVGAVGLALASLFSRHISTSPPRSPPPIHRSSTVDRHAAEAVEAHAGVGDQVLRGGGRGGGGGVGGRRARAVQAGALRVLPEARVVPEALVDDQQPGVVRHGGGGVGEGRRRGGGGRRRRGRPAAALLLQLLRAPVHHARLLQQLPARGGRLRRRPQGLRRRRNAPGAPATARRRQASRHRRPPGPPGVAGGGDFLGSVPAPAPGEATGLLLRGRGAPPRLRVHAARQPREPPLQEDIGDGAVGHAAEDRHRRRQGPRLPPRRLHPRHLPRLQGLQHPPRLGVHGEAVGLRAGKDGAGGVGDARDDAGDGHARLRGAGVRHDGAPQHQERRVQLRRRAPRAPHGAARHGARQGQERPRRPGGQDRRLDPPLPRQQPPPPLHHGPEARRPLLRQGSTRRRPPRRAVHQPAAARQATHGRRRRGARAAAGVQGHGRHRRPLAHQRPRRRQERHLRQDPRRGQGRRRLHRRRGLAAAERLRQAALILMESCHVRS